MSTETNPTPSQPDNLETTEESPVLEISEPVELTPPVTNSEHAEPPATTPETTEPPVVLVGHDYDNEGVPINSTENTEPQPSETQPPVATTPETTEPPVVLVGHDYDTDPSTSTHATTEQPEKTLPATGNDHIQNTSVLATVLVMIGAGLTRLRHPRHR